MAFNRPKPVAFKPEMLASLVEEAQTQKVGGSYQKSNDPAFPYWVWEPAKQYLIYIPRLVTLDAEGKTVLDIDKPLIHDIKSNGSYGKIRCTRNIVLNDPETGEPLVDANGKALFDGSCPVCDGVSDGFELAKLGIENECSLANLNPEDKANESVKSIRGRHFSERQLKQPDRKLTFPVVVFDTLTDENGRIGLTQGEDKKPVYTVNWYTISERQFGKTWQEAIELAEEPRDTIAGLVFLVQFGKKDANNNVPDMRDAAKDLTVQIRSAYSNKFEESGIGKEIDAAVKGAGWSKSKAAEVLTDNQFLSVPDIESSVASIRADMATKIQMYKTPQGSASAIAQNGGGVSLDALRGGSSPANGVNNAPAGALPAGATDADEAVATGGLLG